MLFKEILRISFVALLLIPFLKITWKGPVTVLIILLNILISTSVAWPCLTGDALETVVQGSYIFGEIPLRLDSLSAWFILTINFTFLTGAWFGWQYMKSYESNPANLSFHYIALIILHTAMLAICVVQHSIAFLTAWEVMALSAFFLVIFEHGKTETIRAGINYLIQSHICILLLTIAFIWVASRTNSYDFQAIHKFSLDFSPLVSLVLFLIFFAGFGIKAGFVPFHTWLPYAHPAAPSHISGMMSGVIIKLGIYGLLRMIFLIQGDYIVMGYIIITVSVISGLYGVMLAIIQHNLKKLLAYHSIENIGIIGIGIGLGTLGMGLHNTTLIYCGFGGGLLHVLNHSLFKSLLFYSAGTVYQATHLLDIDKLGGLVKKMPHSAFLFLLAALAICGLPPFNGFVSEFMIYFGLFSSLKEASTLTLVFSLGSIIGLVLIGGLAVLCFTKAFGTVFLGTPRHHLHEEPTEAHALKLIPQYLVAVMILFIGLVPQFFLHYLISPIALIANHTTPADTTLTESISAISFAGFVFVGIVVTLFVIRKMVTSARPVRTDATWGCGYVGNASKMQYTASSFIRTYRKLAEPLLSIHKNKIMVSGVFPTQLEHKTHPYDRIEEKLIDIPLKNIKLFLSKFGFLQSGDLQQYVLNGVLFITAIIVIPLVVKSVEIIISFIEQL
jgi:formate hydrogenlyase subunit 3/multisubunit Na+/H+ antiporter MnhD subunit